MTKSYTTRTTCRVCGSPELTPLFSLGEQCVSDFPDKDDLANPIRVPIDIDLCRSCTLVQARHTAPVDLLYKGTYWYRSGTTQTMRNALKEIVTEVCNRVDLQPGDVVLDIGSNDGTLLRCFKSLNNGSMINLVGVEPASNLAQEGRVGLTHFINNLWSADRYFDCVSEHDKTIPSRESITTKPLAKIITAIGMFYDLESPNQFIADVAKVLHPDGLFVAQLMCLKQTLEKRDVGNFAHEHLEFYSIRSLDRLLKKSGLVIVDIEENVVNGGSYRLYVRHEKSLINNPPPTDGTHRYDAYKLDEKFIGPNTFYSFFQEIDCNRNRCVQFVKDIVADGKKVWVYGASTKGNVIAQFYGLDRTLIQAAADRDPNKWGRYMVGSEIPIASEEQFRAANPDYAIVMPYAFLGEFVARESEWRSRGGKFIVPLPEFRVI